jgi:hypothetical protein
VGVERIAALNLAERANLTQQREASTAPPELSISVVGIDPVAPLASDTVFDAT